VRTTLRETASAIRAKANRRPDVTLAFMFSKIPHANDGSDLAFRAFALALDISKQDTAAFHLVCVEEIPYLPEYIEEVREETGVAARRFHSVLQKARGMAEQRERPTSSALRPGTRRLPKTKA
jgi:hypothetical protein